MKIMNLKNEKGAIGTDAFIAILVITLFVGLIATLTYNIYISTMETKRTSQATAYIVEIFEHIDKLYYNDVTESNLVDYINSKYNNAENAEIDSDISDVNIASARNVTNIENTEDTKELLTTPYKIEVSIKQYDEQFDLVKTITVTVKYNVGMEEQKLTMTKVKAKENLITPNEPNISSIEPAEGKNVYAVKYTGESWYVTNAEKDTTWYNYENGYWATVFICTKSFEEGDQVLRTDLGDYYIWIPRYAYNSTNKSDIEFLYENTEQFVNEQGNLENLPEGYTIVEGRMDKNI